MITIRTLNKDPLSDEDAPTIRKEAQEEIAFDLYNNALRLQIEGTYDEAKHVLQNLLDDNIPQLESQGGLPKTMSTLKYSCYYNLGNIAKKENDHKAAFDNYLMAAELDGSNVTLWYKIGMLALKLDKFRQAINAFMQGLKCNESHWPCLDQLIILLFAIRDTIACLFYIAKGLSLNPDYTRGHVIRKQIYENNPAAEEYFRLHSPDSYADSNFYISISEDDEKLCLEDVNKILYRFNDVEESLKTKPLPIVSLRKPLEEYTWISLGDTLIHLHKHISNAKMSHCCQVRLSQIIKENPATEPILAPNSCMEIDKLSDNKSEIPEPPPKCDVFDNIERRMSVNSENNTDENLNSSQAEDNDEMDQDTEDPEENSEQKVEKKQAGKRRRDLLLDLQIWGWHSKRVKACKKNNPVDEDGTLESVLKKILPAHFLPNGLQIESLSNTEDTMNTLDMYEKNIERNTTTSGITSPPTNLVNNEQYFGSEQEKDDVANFWNKSRECCDAVILIEEYVNRLATMWYLKWPEKLLHIYVEAYYMYREHIEHPPLFHSNVPFEELRNDALATLLFGEIYHYYGSGMHIKGDPIHPTSLVFLQLISTWEEKWDGEYIAFSVRVHWLRAHIYRKHSETTLAILSLQMVRQNIPNQSDYCLNFVNYAKYPYITLEIVETLLKHLEMVESVSHLEQLYNAENYVKVAEIVKTTFMCIGTPATSGKMGRPAQLGILMHSLWFLDKGECFVWTEKCLNEAVIHFVKNTKTDNKWDLVLDKCIQILKEIIKLETICVVDLLSPENRYRLIENLCTIVCCQEKSNSTQTIPLNSIVPWIVLHYILLREEQRIQASKCISRTRRKYSKPNIDYNKEVPLSIAVLFAAHECLGPKGWCLTTQGELLHFIIDVIVDKLEMPAFEQLREKIDIHLEQAFFCLYQHFGKKNKASRHLTDHNVNPLSLTWERAQQLYDFYYPTRDALPEFDSFKSLSISSDLEQLLQRIIALIPSECDPAPLSSKVSNFLHGSASDLPDPINFPFKMRAAYYLLGDYYLKQTEVTRSVKYFLLDICINPERLDTWADLALGIASQVESKLNHCERFKNESDFFDKAKSAEICFKRALSLAESHITLWIEFGAFQYMAHSYCSRVLKYESDTFSMEKFETLESKKEDYLNSAGCSFTQALDLYQPDQHEADERWLHHYMLGKVAEKRRKEPVDYLQPYLTAAALLNENNAVYPDKINYHNPQNLAMEALEIHYRIHAAVLKYLELHEGKPILSSVGKMFIKCLDSSNLFETTNKFAEGSPVVPEISKNDDSTEIINCIQDLIAEVEKGDNNEKEKADRVENKSNAAVEDALIPKPIATEMENYIHKNEPDIKIVSTSSIPLQKSADEASSVSSSSSDSSSSGSESDDSSSSSSSSASETSTVTNLTDDEVVNLVNRCIIGLEKCVQRFPQNYKALYRLAHLYFYYKAKKDVSKCKQLLLGEYTCSTGGSIGGLFADHKPTNFFNGVWRIPSSEIDRPGSLAAHMARCVTILLQVLRQSNEHKVLLEVFLQLRRTPDPDKVYMRHLEREQLAEQALSFCILALRAQTKNVTGTNATQRLLLDTYKAYQRIQKHAPNKENVFSSILSEVYKKFAQNQIPETANVLDLALKFCQQHKASEKLKVQQQLLQKLSSAVPAPPVITTSPVVLPTPSTAVPTSSNIPLKRPTLGRPRGRPPGPKPSSLFSSVKPRIPNTGSKSGPAWQNMACDPNTVKYMLQYQKELLRQYTQLTQMNQFQNYANPFVPSTATSLLNCNPLMSSMAHTTTANYNPLALSQSYNQINPNLVQKLMEHSTSSNQVKTWQSKTQSEIKPTYTMANFNKSPQLSSYKYNMPVEQKIQKTSKSTIIDFTSLEARKAQHSTDYVASSIVNKRPNLTITPVNTTPTVPAAHLPQPVVPTVAKTLQEKLADKQKLNKNMAMDKKGNKGKHRIVSTSQPSSSPHVKLPTFSLESGVSISQLPRKRANQSSDQPRVHQDTGNKNPKKHGLMILTKPSVKNMTNELKEVKVDSNDVIIID